MYEPVTEHVSWLMGIRAGTWGNDLIILDMSYLVGI